MQFKTTAKKIGYLLAQTFKGFINDNAFKLSAALSYYTIFSLAPLLIIIISLSGIFFGDEAVSGRIFGQISGLVGSEAALQIQEIIKNVKLSNSNTYAAIFGGIILLIGASGVFAEIQDSRSSRRSRRGPTARGWSSRRPRRCPRSRPRRGRPAPGAAGGTRPR